MSPEPHGDQLLAQHAFVQRLAQALLRDRDLAADVAQDAMVAAIEQRPDCAEPQLLRGWLRTVVRRIAAAARGDLAERQRRERRGARPEGTDAEARAHEQLALHRELTAAVQALPEPYRTAVTLRYLADQAPAVIARQSGASPDVVRQRIHRGLLLLRERLDRDHGSRSAWATPLAAVLRRAPVAPLFATIIMAKPAVVAAALAVVATGTWLAVRSDAPPPSPAPTHTASTAAAGAAARSRLEAAPAPVAAATAGARTSAEFVVTVVDARGAPVAGAEVHCVCGDVPLEHSTTSATGRAVFPARDDGGTLVVRAPARPPLLQQVPVLHGEQCIVLADGLRVAGQVLVDGAPAPSPPGVQLRLETRHDDQEALPPPLADLLQMAATTTTDANGRFAFNGLDATWRGSLELPLTDTHWLLPCADQEQPEHTRLLLRRPIDNLVVATTALPSIRAQVVWDDDGSAVANADVTAHAIFGDDDESPLMGLDADAEGRFSIGFPPGDQAVGSVARRAVQRAFLHVRAQGSDKEFEVPAPLPAAPLTLRLPRGTGTVFRATNRDGSPIAGARAMNGGLADPTDRSGIGTFSGPRERALFGAPGCMIAPCPTGAAAGTADDPLPVVLDPANELRIRAVDAAGERPPFERLEVDVDGNCFAGRPAPTELHYAFGDTRLLAGHSTPGKSSFCAFTLDAHGEVRLHALDVGRTLQLTLLDALGDVVARRSVTVPAVGARETVALEVTAVERQVRGTVFGTGGTPLADARVDVNGSGTSWHRGLALSAADGSFCCRGISNPGQLTVTVARAGYATQERGLAPGETTLVFALEPSRRIALRVVDGNGALVPVERVLVHGVLGQWQQESPNPGEFTFPDMPQRDVTFAVQLGGREFACTPDPAATAAELRVPVPARVGFGPLPPGFVPPAHGFFEVRGQSLDPHAEPFHVGLDGDRPELLPPGRYRFVLVRLEWSEQRKEYVVSELQAAAEVDLVAGATATVTLQ